MSKAKPAKLRANSRTKTAKTRARKAPIELLDTRLQPMQSASVTSFATPDMVNHPPHYKRGGVECVDVLEAMVTGWSPQTAARIGQAFEYIFRHAHKRAPVSDLKKAVWWIQREIDALESEERAHG